jgi:putative transposase
MKYMFIDEYRSEHSVEMMCHVLGVSRSGYYAWQRCPVGPREQANRELLEHIRRFHRESRETYGSPRITYDLRAMGVRCSKNRVARLMRRNSIVAKSKRRFKVTTRAKNGAQYAPDRLQRSFASAKPNRVWTSDITYIWTREGWLYLAVVLDLFSRRIIGWATSTWIDAELVCAALRRALDRRGIPEEVIFHSDRGSQYTSLALQELISKHLGVILQSHGVSCYDNAVTESFFHTLKTECTSFEHYETREDAHRSLFDYIEVFYNRQRRHSSLGYRTPCEVEQSTTQPN